MTYASKQIQARWSIVPLCEKHHGVGNYMDAGTLMKERNLWIALNRANEEEIRSISKAVDYSLTRDRLNKKYGVYTKPRIVEIEY